MENPREARIASFKGRKAKKQKEPLSSTVFQQCKTEFVTFLGVLCGTLWWALLVLGSSVWQQEIPDPVMQPCSTTTVLKGYTSSFYIVKFFALLAMPKGHGVSGPGALRAIVAISIITSE